MRMDGNRVAGKDLPLPAEVVAKLSERRGPGQGLGLGQGRGQGGRGLRRGWEGGPTEPQARFVLRTDNPTRYWVGLHLPLTESEATPPRPLVLLLVSNSLTAGGLFVDFKPWLIVGASALVFSVLFWIPLVRSLTRSLSRITNATRQIAEGRFDTRVDDRRSDELGHLGQAINSMAARLSGFVAGQKRCLGDIAHELCSPLARIQVAVGILEQRADPKQQASVADLREEVQEMSNLINELLSFTRAGLAAGEIRFEPVDLATMAREVAARESSGSGNVQLEIPSDLRVLAEPRLLSRALANLVRNAVRYAGGAGPISLTASRLNNEVALVIADEGPGVPEASLQQIFDPFYRGEPSRSRETGGVGLGLAIVKTCVEACRGRVQAVNRSPRGLEVRVVLPSA
jgi:two-component system sensor histidine kinase CpxA